VFGVDALQDGTYVAAAHFYLDTPASNYAYTRMDWRLAGNSGWNVGAMIEHASGTIQMRISGLLTGATLDFRFVSVNNLGIASAGVTLLNAAMPRDTQPPAQPAPPFAEPQRNRTVLIAVSPVADRDFKTYEFWITHTAPLPTGGVVTYGALPAPNSSGAPYNGTQSWHNIAYDGGFANDTPYWLHIRSVDYSGNYSAWSGATQFTFASPGALPQFAMAWWEIEQQGSDGGTTASIVLSVSTPTSPMTHVVIDYEVNGEQWTSRGVVNHLMPPDTNNGIRIKGLIPGVPYNFRGVAVNALNIAGPQSVWSGTAPNDTTAPPVPTGLTVWVATNYVFVHCGVSGADFKALPWYITTAAGTGGALNGSGVLHGSTSGQRDNAIEFSIAAGSHLANGSTYHLYVRAQDYSGNFSAWANSVPFSYVTHDTPDLKVNAVSHISTQYTNPGARTGSGIGVAPFAFGQVFVTSDPGDVLLAWGGGVVYNVSAQCIARVVMRNVSKGVEAAPVEFTINPGHEVGLMAIAADLAISGVNQIDTQLTLGPAGTTYNYSYGCIQVLRMKR
jgi:hypothetical protein